MNQERQGMESGKLKTRKRTAWPMVALGTISLVLVAGICFQIFRPQSGQAIDRETAKKMVEDSKTRQTAGKSPPKTLARVGNEVISWDEVAEECIVRHGNEVLDNLINRKIIEQATLEKKVQISEAEVDQEISRVATKFGMKVDQWYQYLQTERDTPAMNYRRDVVWPMLALKKLAGTDVKISEKDLEEAFVREYGERVRVKAIVLDNSRRAMEVYQKLEAAPDDFEKLVRENSVDAASRSLGGAIPPIQRFSGNPSSQELEERAFKMKEGEISPVVQVGPQYLILRCEGRTEPVVTSIDEVRDQLYEDLKERKTQELVAVLFDKLKSETRVDNYLTRQKTEGKKGTSPIKQTGLSSGEGTGDKKVVPAGKTTKRASAEE